MISRVSRVVLALLLWSACAAAASGLGARVAEHLAKRLAGAGGETRVVVLDRGLSRSAARGAGYAGSLNLTLTEARDLGASIGCDFYLTGDAQVLRRSSSERPVYFEAYATLFVVSARSGRLVSWTRPAAEADNPDRAEAALFAPLDGEETTRLLSSIAAAWAAEAHGPQARHQGPAGEGEGDGETLDLTSGETIEGLREPAPYSRLRPAYTEAAARAEAEATVDAEVELGADGRVRAVRVVRWAGFGLDEEVAATVRRMSFRPATLGNEPRPSRVLLRYNFRRPQQPAK